MVKEEMPDDPHAGLAGLLSKALAEAREVATAEIDVQKARVAARLADYRMAAIFFGAGAILALGALIALLVGALLVLSPRVGPMWATAIVVIGTLLIAGLSAVIGRVKMKAAILAGRRS